MEQQRVLRLGVLGILNEDESTLNTIQKRFNHRFGRHQFAGYGALEPVIKRLCEDGYITGTISYSITESGRSHLRTLLCEPVSDVSNPNNRPHLLLKLGFIHHLPHDSQYEELAHLEDQFDQQRLKWMERATTHTEMTHSENRPDLIDLTIRLMETQLEWIRECRQSL